MLLLKEGREGQSRLTGPEFYYPRKEVLLMGEALRGEA